MRLAVTAFALSTLVGCINYDDALTRYCVDNPACAIDVSPSDAGHLWSTRIAGQGLEVPEAIAAAPEGALVTVGSYTAQLQLGATTLEEHGGKDLFIARLAADGGVTWARGAGGPLDDTLSAVALGGGGAIFVAGSFASRGLDLGPTVRLGAVGSQDGLVARYGGDGTLAWARTFNGGPRGVVSASGIDTSASPDRLIAVGHYVGTGSFAGAVATPSTQERAYAVRLEASGDGAALLVEGGCASGAMRATAVRIDTARSAYLAGTYEGSGCAVGTVALSDTVAGRPGLWVARLAPAGALSWAKGFHEANLTTPPRLAVDSADQPVVVASLRGRIARPGNPIQSSTAASDALVLKLDTAGELLWGAAHGGAGDDEARAVAVDADNHTWVAGAFTSANARFGTPDSFASRGETDLFLARYDLTGAAVAAYRFGDTSAQSFRGIALHPTSVSVCGVTAGALDLGGGPLPGQNADAFFARFRR